MKKRNNILLVTGICTVLAAVSTLGVYAYLQANTLQSENNFTGVVVNLAVHENGSKTDLENATNNINNLTKISRINEVGKKEVAIFNKNVDEDGKVLENTGPLYVRVRLVSSIVSDTDNSVLGSGAKVEYTFEQNTKWVYNPKDGAFYFTQPVAPGAETDMLLKSVKLLENIKEGYHLEVKVLADGIASEQKDALQEAWGMTSFEGMTPVKGAIKMN